MNTIHHSPSRGFGSVITVRAARAVAMSAGMLLWACASLQPTHTGFLQDYDSLRPSSVHPQEGVFRKTGLDAGRYHAFVVEPVVFRPARQSDLDASDVAKLTAEYQEALRLVFARHLPQTDTSGPGVLIVRAAVTDICQAHPVVNAITMAAVLVPVTAGAASTEAEVIDGASGERLAALQAVTNGGRAFLGGPAGYLSTYGQARRALARQAGELAEELFGPDAGGREGKSDPPVVRAF